jgi:uncharacterized alpha-E superfamily protein
MMLSRTADHLYWMSRYTERAENLARMLQVNVRMNLLQRHAEEPDRAWAATLAMLGQLEAYRTRCGAVLPEAVLRFLAFDAGNPGSIVSDLQAARENARAVRGTLTSEQWETINDTWLELHGRRLEGLTTDELTDFFEWVKFRSHLLRGVTQGTMLRDEGFDFTRIGTFLERADNTTRLLDVQLRLLAPEGVDEGTPADYYKYSALLASVSAFEIYRKVYRDRITPARVAELLILREDMPRSLHRCVNELVAHLAAVANDHSEETLRRAGALQARLRYGHIDQILEQGVHEFLDGFLLRIRDLGARIAQDFLVSAAS